MNVSVSEKDQQVLFESVSEMYSAIDSLIESLTQFAENQHQRIDCKKGCEWCCHQPVFALSFELEYLNDFISRNFTKETQIEIRKRAAIKNNKLGMLIETNLPKTGNSRNGRYAPVDTCAINEGGYTPEILIH